MEPVTVVIGVFAAASSIISALISASIKKKSRSRVEIIVDGKKINTSNISARDVQNILKKIKPEEFDDSYGSASN